MWSLVVGVMVALTSPCLGHVGLYYPPARTYALDFLDSARTVWPCGMQRGRGPVTDLEAGSTFVVSWYLGYAHHGGYRLELMSYNEDGSVNTTYNLTSGYVGADNMTRTSQSVTLPAEVTSCTNCTVRLVRQALEWGSRYVFWSCADVNIVPRSSYSPSCLGHGTYNVAATTCQCNKPYSGFSCQFKDECVTDSDCGSHGKCLNITDFSYPQKQCFCQPGYFGFKCEKVSPVKSTAFNPNDYTSRTLSRRTNTKLYFRIVQGTTGRELEVVLQAKTNSYIGFGWKPRGLKCDPYSLRPGRPSPEGEPETEPEGSNSTTPRPEGEPEVEPEGSTTPRPESEPEGEPSTTPAPEPENEPSVTAPHVRTTPRGEPEGEPSTSPRPEGEPEGEPSTTPRPEGEPEGSPSPKTEGEPESEPSTTSRPVNEPIGEPTTTPSPEPEDSIGDGTGMDCVDIVIGAAVGTLSRVGDYYTADRSTPRHDEFYGGSQSLTAAVASESADGITTVIFRRPITATEKTDHSIRNEVMSLIWAHGQVNRDIEYFYPPDEIKYHAKANRGRISLNFFGAGQPPPNANRWSSPMGCSGSACKYAAEWTVDKDNVRFTISAKQDSDHWTGIAFAPEPRMENMDVYIGYMDSNQTGHTFDGFTGRQHSKPVKDASQNMMNAAVTYRNGMLTLNFERPRNTGDSKDVRLFDDDCHYFMFPVGGGRHSNRDFLQHSDTPVISAKKMCIGGKEPKDNTVTMSREQYNHLMHRKNTFMIATIVLTVFSGLAILVIIVLVRFYIVRQHTANDYSLQK